MRFAVRLKELRLEKNIRVVDLAKETGMSKSILYAYEKEEREPPATAVIRLARFFGVTTDYILGEKDY